MLRFFRQLRKDQLMSETTQKYILYAMGEIALVVVGILIALQINNWNEDRILRNEINSYLSKKVDKLIEDQEQLNQLIEDRMELFEICHDALNQGLVNMPDRALVDLVLDVTVEKRFISAVDGDETDNNTNYYKRIKDAQISDLEVDYLNQVELIVFAEQRLNEFSENLEGDLWRGGFFSDNTAYFNAFDDEVVAVTEPVILNEGNGLKSLTGIVKRNELINNRLVRQYRELLTMNKQLVLVTQDYLMSQ